MEVWIDHRSASSKKGKVLLRVQRLLKPAALFNISQVKQATGNLTPEERKMRYFPTQPYHPQEFVIIRDPTMLLTEDKLKRFVPQSLISIDLAFGSQVTKLPTDLDVDSIPAPNHLIRRSWHTAFATFAPMVLTPTIAGELEIKQFTRDYLMDEFSRSPSVLSVPIVTFNDGFGLYRSMYKSIMGVYLFLANLTGKESNRQANVFPLTLGPHGSNFADVAEAIKPMWRALEAGIHLDIKGKSFLVCAFNFAFKTDMPQNNSNSGCLGPTANKGCQMCLTKRKER